MRKLLMGNEAIAFGAIASKVKVVCGYPGTPSTEVLETVAKNNNGNIYVEWSINEKVAMEIAAGASYTGARVLVTMKQVGLNVASDPLMSLNYIGVKGGLVVLVADDPGPFSSQTEQDTRHYAKFSNIPVFDPSNPQEAYDMVQAAFELSEKRGTPVFLRPTTRVCHGSSSVEISEQTLAEPKTPKFEKDPKWVIFPPLANRRHTEIEKSLNEIALEFSTSPFNKSIGVSGKTGVVASGVAYSYLREVIKENNLDIKLMKIGTAFPFPSKLAKEFLEGLDKVLVFEELDPVIEEALLEIVGEGKIYGKKTGNLPFAGEYSVELVYDALMKFIGCEIESREDVNLPPLPSRPSVLCAGCPHRASFYAVKKATKGKNAIYTGDIGCYTLGNAKPLDMVDTCLCMGAGITVAQGLKRAEPDACHIAFIGDSTFFHSGITGVINAVYNNTDITVIILDNATTAMTGHQPHPGTGETMMGSISEKIDIEGLLKACGVKVIYKLSPFDQKQAIEKVKSAVEYKGVSAVIFEAPCIIGKTSPLSSVKTENCRGCGLCVKELGCPAMSLGTDKKIQIEASLCTKCGLCTQMCPFEAGEVK